MLQVQLIGALTLAVDGTAVPLPSSGRARALLAWLALHPGAQSRAAVAAQFWPDVLDSSARSSLRTTLRTLRQELGDTAAGYLVATRDDVGLERVSTDLQRLDELLSEGEDAKAVELGLRGELVPGIEDEWVHALRDEHRERMLATLGRLASDAERGGDLAAAVAWTRRQVALDPLTEMAHRDLIRRLAASGDRAAALASYERMRDVLRTELSLAPSAQTRALVEALRSDRSAAPVSPVAAAAPASGVQTVLFTDLVESTAHLQQLGDERYEAVRQEHFGLLRAALRAHGGREVKSTGDGLMAAFTSARDAIACAIEMQRSIARGARHGGGGLLMRAGLHVGEVIGDSDDDLYGSVVVIARRLCDSAHGAQILASTLVRDLCGQLGDDRFGETFELSLKGLNSAQATCEVRWAPAKREPAPLPEAFVREPASPMVGRTAELVQLKERHQQAATGSLQLVLIGGEPGIGKTRLVRELCLGAHADGAEILLGRCYEESVVPFQPFVEALRRMVAGADPRELAELARSCHLGELAGLVPELATRLPGLDAPAAPDSPEGRFRLFETVAKLVSELAARSGAVLVLDDVHWADPPTLALLRHVQRAVGSTPLLVLGTYRSSEVVDSSPLAQLLADLRREQSAAVEMIELGGLKAPQVEQLISDWAGRPAPLALARGVCRDTDGNPFFAQEVLRHLSESGRLFDSDGGWITERAIHDAGTPQGVKDVINRRLARLDEGVQETLALAAVVGRRFSLDVLAGVSDSETDQLVVELEQAVNAGVVVEPPGPIGRYTFAHALIREALYERLSATRRVHMHQRVGQAIERLNPRDRGPVLGLLAYHFARAAAVGGRERALEYAVDAAQHSLATFAYEQAVINYQTALEVLGDADGRRRCEMLLMLGEAQIRAGEAAGADVTFALAADAARSIGSASRLARAVLGLGGGGLGGLWAQAPGTADTAYLDLLREARAALADGHPLADRVAAREAVQLHYLLRLDEARELSAAVLARARTQGDASTLLYALAARTFCVFNPDDTAEHPKLAQELTARAEESLDLEVAFTGHSWLLTDALTFGRLADAERELARCEAIATRLGQPRTTWFIRIQETTRATMDGRFADAERIAHESFEIGRTVQEPAAAQILAVQLAFIRAGQARLGERIVEIEAMGENFERLPAWRAWLAFRHATVGDLDAAVRVLEPLSGARVAAIPRDENWLVTLTSVGRAATLIGDLVTVEHTYELLAPFVDRHVLVSLAIAYAGPVAFHAGGLAAALGDLSSAEEYLTAAIDAARAVRSPPWEARASVALAGVLIAAGQAGRRAEALELLHDGLATARRLGLAELAGAEALAG